MTFKVLLLTTINLFNLLNVRGIIFRVDRISLEQAQLSVVELLAELAFLVFDFDGVFELVSVRGARRQRVALEAPERREILRIALRVLALGIRLGLNGHSLILTLLFEYVCLGLFVEEPTDNLLFKLLSVASKAPYLFLLINLLYLFTLDFFSLRVCLKNLGLLLSLGLVIHSNQISVVLFFFFVINHSLLLLLVTVDFSIFIDDLFKVFPVLFFVFLFRHGMNSWVNSHQRVIFLHEPISIELFQFVLLSNPLILLTFVPHLLS